jgi:hypothetical protein
MPWRSGNTWRKSCATEFRKVKLRALSTSEQVMGSVRAAPTPLLTILLMLASASGTLGGGPAGVSRGGCDAEKPAGDPGASRTGTDGVDRDWAALRQVQPGPRALKPLTAITPGRSAPRSKPAGVNLTSGARPLRRFPARRPKWRFIGRAGSGEHVRWVVGPGVKGLRADPEFPQRGDVLRQDFMNRPRKTQVPGLDLNYLDAALPLTASVDASQPGRGQADPGDR